MHIPSVISLAVVWKAEELNKQSPRSGVCVCVHNFVESNAITRNTKYGGGFVICFLVRPMLNGSGAPKKGNEAFSPEGLSMFFIR